MTVLHSTALCLCSTTNEADSGELKVGDGSLEPKEPVVAAGTADAVAPTPNAMAVDSSSTVASSTLQNSE